MRDKTLLPAAQLGIVIRRCKSSAQLLRVERLLKSMWAAQTISEFTFGYATGSISVMMLDVVER